MNSRPAGGELADPMFFGLLEGICFFCLFASLLLPEAGRPMLWMAIALLRVVVLGVMLLPSRGSREPPERGRTPGLAAGFLGRGMLYQVPFWLSALLFPLQTGQTSYALTSLLLQSAMLVLLPLLARWAKPLGAEALVYLLSLAWIMGWQAPGPWLFAALLALLATFRGGWSLRAWGWELTPWQGLAIGLAWLATFALPPLSSPASITTGTTLLFWLLLLYLGAVMSALQRESWVNEEAESAAPCLLAAKFWLIGRRSLVVALGWSAMLALVVRRPEELIAMAILVTAWWRALELSARGWFTPERGVWWAAMEITLIWLATQTPPEVAVGVLWLSLFYAAAVRLRRQPSGELSLAFSTLAGVESALALGLRQAAPDEFAARVLEETGSVELDKDLTALAPAGFRERLLQRLRQSSEDHEERE